MGSILAYWSTSSDIRSSSTLDASSPEAVNSGTSTGYYGDAGFAPLYWGYGRPGEYADRREMRKHYDEEVMHTMPDTILVLLKATPDAIRSRMSEGKSLFPERHAATMFKAEDAEVVLGRFQEEFENSLLAHSFSIDTTDSTVEESLQEFVTKVEPHRTPTDRERIATQD